MGEFAQRCVSSGNSRDILPPKYLSLDGAAPAAYYKVDMENIAPGYGNGPVKCDDNGVELEAIMVAGSVGIQRSESGKALDDGGFGVDCMQPVTGWWMFEKHAAKK